MGNIDENKNFFVELLKKIENFNLLDFKKNRADNKEKKNKLNAIKQELDDSKTTIDDISLQRKSHIKHLAKKILLLGFIIVLITGALILAFQDNEQKVRPSIEPKQVFNGSTSFGNIGDKDYFLEQNILNDKINKVHIEAKEDIKSSTSTAIAQLEQKQTQLLDDKLTTTKNDILEVVDTKIKKIDISQSNIKDELIKIKNTKEKPQITLSNGKIVFPDLNKQDSHNQEQLPKVNTEKFVEIEQEVYVEEEIDITNNNVVQTNYVTNNLEQKSEKKFKPFKLDLTKSMAKVTLLEGVKAAASFAGLENTTPVLMIIDDVLYTANDTVADLKGCFLSGAAIGNINTSRVEIFGTSMSCIIVANNGKKFKIEQTFTDNKVWVKGEDGGTGIQGQIVDSSGKVLAKSAAIGFIQGLANYLQTNATTAQNVVTADGTVTQVQALQNSLKVGAAQGINSGFELILKKYEKILDGYFPYVDTKGGRKNLTVVFDGKMELEVTEYFEPNIEELQMNNLIRGYTQ